MKIRGIEVREVIGLESVPVARSQRSVPRPDYKTLANVLPRKNKNVAGTPRQLGGKMRPQRTVPRRNYLSMLSSSPSQGSESGGEDGRPQRSVPRRDYLSMVTTVGRSQDSNKKRKGASPKKLSVVATTKREKSHNVSPRKKPSAPKTSKKASEESSEEEPSLNVQSGKICDKSSKKNIESSKSVRDAFLKRLKEIEVCDNSKSTEVKSTSLQQCIVEREPFVVKPINEAELRSKGRYSKTLTIKTVDRILENKTTVKEKTELISFNSKTPSTKKIPAKKTTVKEKTEGWNSTTVPFKKAEKIPADYYPVLIKKEESELSGSPSSTILIKESDKTIVDAPRRNKRKDQHKFLQDLGIVMPILDRQNKEESEVSENETSEDSQIPEIKAENLNSLKRKLSQNNKLKKSSAFEEENLPVPKEINSDNNNVIRKNRSLFGIMKEREPIKSNLSMEPKNKDIKKMKQSLDIVVQEIVGLNSQSDAVVSVAPNLVHEAMEPEVGADNKCDFLGTIKLTPKKTQEQIFSKTRLQKYKDQLVNKNIIVEEISDKEINYCGEIKTIKTEVLKPPENINLTVAYENIKLINENAKSTDKNVAFVERKIKRRKGYKNFYKSKQKYECTYCQQSFHYRKHLTRHMYVHQGLRRYTCDVCDKKFQQQTNLVQHRKNLHCGARNHQCDICLKLFTVVTNVLAHQKRYHHKRSSYKCSFCTFKFPNYQLLLKHARVHVHKKFQCPYPYCNYYFKRIDTLHRHMFEFHNIELRSFICDHCGCEFLHKRAIIDHLGKPCYLNVDN